MGKKKKVQKKGKYHLPCIFTSMVGRSSLYYVQTLARPVRSSPLGRVELPSYYSRFWLLAMALVPDTCIGAAIHWLLSVPLSFLPAPRIVNLVTEL